MSETFGKYQILRHLADGGMATIWVAEQIGPQGFARYVAIKRLLPEFEHNPLLREMFLDEARLASELSHPHIGQVYELGEVNGEHFIAMELIDGLSLEDVIQQYAQSGPIPAELAARLMVNILDALEYAHRANDRDGKPLGIVHRDVTPSNILISNDGIAKLVDFGVAKATKHRTATQSGAIKGKYAYMSPEQISGQEITPQSDIFALGITFFELLTGKKPFGDDLVAVSAIIKDPTPDPRELRPGIPNAFVQILSKALEKDRTQRYPSARSMALDLETALRQQNAYITPLEISVYIRTLRGLPIDVDASSEIDTGIFSADRSVETIFAVPPKQEKPVAPSPLTAIEPKHLLIGAAATLLLFVLIAVLWPSTDDVKSRIPPGARMVLSEVSKVEPDAVPTAMSHDDGRFVTIETLPEAELHHVNVFVGTTPINTRLKPGFYKVVFKLGDLEKRATIEVTDTPVTRYRAVLAELEDAPKRTKKR